jgi:hypothetical protein
LSAIYFLYYIAQKTDVKAVKILHHRLGYADLTFRKNVTTEMWEYDSSLRGLDEHGSVIIQDPGKVFSYQYFCGGNNIAISSPVNRRFCRPRSLEEKEGYHTFDVPPYQLEEIQTINEKCLPVPVSSEIISEKFAKVGGNARKILVKKIMEDFDQIITDDLRTYDFKRCVNFLESNDIYSGKEDRVTNTYIQLFPKEGSYSHFYVNKGFCSKYIEERFFSGLEKSLEKDQLLDFLRYIEGNLRLRHIYDRFFQSTLRRKKY